LDHACCAVKLTPRVQHFLPRIPIVEEHLFCVDKPILVRRSVIKGMAQNPLGCCGQQGDMPDLSWNQVLQHFAKSMVMWVASGMALANERLHGQRHGKCQVCPHKKGFWCKKCKCIAYIKTKLATEGCPDIPPRWTPMG
jgi:hypothetical protein